MDKGTTSHNEDPVTMAIEDHTRKVPSSTFLAAAIAAMATAAMLRWVGKKELALFIGEWVPTILIMGVYNKLAKQTGAESDSANRTSNSAIAD